MRLPCDRPQTARYTVQRKPVSVRTGGTDPRETPRRHFANRPLLLVGSRRYIDREIGLALAGGLAVDRSNTPPSSPASDSGVRRLAVAVGLLWLVAASGCADYDFERDPPERGTLGEELFATWRKDAARAVDKSDARVDLLDRREEEFVASVDRTVPPDRVQAFDRYLRRIDEPIETGTLPSLTRKVRIGLEAAADRQALMEELADGGGRDPASFVAPTNRAHLTEHLVEYDALGQAGRETVDYLLASDGYTPSGERDAEESTAFLDLQYVAVDALRGAGENDDGDDASGGPTFPTLLRDILLVEDDQFAPDDGSETPLYAARFDRRGLPLVLEGQNGGVAAPFVDRDDDGLADVDEQGRFRLESGGTARAPAFAETDDDTDDGPLQRDAFGRAVQEGDPVFDYFDLRRSGLFFMTRQLGRLNEKGALWDLGRGLPALFGERTRREDDHGSYRGYTDDQPLVRALRAALDTLAFSELPALLRSLADFVEHKGDAIAEMVDALGDAAEIVEETPNTQLHDDSTVTYDLLPVVEKITANPELWRDVMESLEDPIVARTGDAMATMIRFRDPTTVPTGPNSPYNQCFENCRETWEQRATDEHPNGIGLEGRFECIRQECPTEELFQKETDFEADESKSNRSVFQQILHLLRDTAGTPYELEVVKADVAGIELDSLPPVVSLPGAAEAFVRTIAGNLDMKNYISEDIEPLVGAIPGLSNNTVAAVLSLLSDLFGAHLDQKPTPSQITRLFNQSDLKFESDGITVDLSEPVCKDEYKMANHHADKLFAAEAAGLIDTLQPIARAFSNHDREDLLLDLFVVMHDHYSKYDDLYKMADGTTPSPMKGANLVSYEPALHEIAKRGDIFEALGEFARAADEVKTIDGEPFQARLRQVVRRAVVADESFQGGDASKAVELPDGRRIQPASRAHYILRELGDLTEQLDDRPEARDRLQSALGSLSEVMFPVETTDDGAKFARPGSLKLAAHANRAVADYADHLVEEDELEQISDDWPPAVRDFATSRGWSAAHDFAAGVAEKESRRRAITGLVDHLTGNRDGAEVTTLYGFETLVGVANAGDTDAAAEWSADMLDPKREWETETRQTLPLASHALMVSSRFLAERGGEEPYGVGLVRRGLQSPREGPRPLPTIGGVISDYFRADPASKKPYTAEDYRSVARGLAGWIGDDVHGLEQLYDIVTQGAR